MPVPTTPHEHIQLIRRKQELLPEFGVTWGDRIFEEVLRGDELQDDVDILMTELGLYSDENPDLDGPVLDDLIDACWSHIMHRIHQRIRTVSNTDGEGQ